MPWLRSCWRPGSRTDQLEQRLFLKIATTDRSERPPRCTHRLGTQIDSQTWCEKLHEAFMKPHDLEDRERYGDPQKIRTRDCDELTKELQLETETPLELSSQPITTLHRSSSPPLSHSDPQRDQGLKTVRMASRAHVQLSKLPRRPTKHQARHDKMPR